jgi:hypothetical protein
MAQRRSGAGGTFCHCQRRRGAVKVLFLVRSPNELFSPSTIGESVREAVGSANRTPTQYTPWEPLIEVRVNSPKRLLNPWGGDDKLFQGDHCKQSLSATAVNTANKVALYNFLSTLSGTHFVTPRALTAELRFHF